ncbi:molybdopterin-guanine dinucleotide biosynthesis protein B [Undibacterium sp.]|uniref:molybdopterin-guanine dinucleotide biosynthesis protein B n=1 Tax=Undibacterium sp. TaxID=1914977 RepID=UPI00375018E2
MHAAVLGVVGWSGSGKTTLLEFLIAELVKSGKTVNVVKHSHHDVTLEPAHKDSAKLRNAGAAQVLLASPFRYAIVKELRSELEPSLQELLEKLDPADLTLVEGYKWANLPKLEVYRPSLDKSAIYPDDKHIVAVASDVARLDGCPSQITWLNLNSPEEILAWIHHGLLEDRFLQYIETQ